jgi:hypothetical protein
MTHRSLVRPQFWLFRFVHCLCWPGAEGRHDRDAESRPRRWVMSRYPSFTCYDRSVPQRTPFPARPRSSADSSFKLPGKGRIRLIPSRRGVGGRGTWPLSGRRATRRAPPRPRARRERHLAPWHLAPCGPSSATGIGASLSERAVGSPLGVCPSDYRPIVGDPDSDLWDSRVSGPIACQPDWGWGSEGRCNPSLRGTSQTYDDLNIGHNGYIAHDRTVVLPRRIRCARCIAIGGRTIAPSGRR